MDEYDELCSESSWDPNDDEIVNLEIPHLKASSLITPRTKQKAAN
jgi:hypothetical protein